MKVTIEAVKEKYGFTDTDLKHMNTDVVKQFLKDNLVKLEYITSPTRRKELLEENEYYRCLLEYVEGKVE